MENISIKTLAKFVRKMRISNGDIIAIKSGTVLANKRTVDELSEAIGALNGKGKCVLIVVDDFDDLRVLDEKAMNERGWFYVDTLQKIIHQVEEKRNAVSEVSLDEAGSPAVRDSDTDSIDRPE